MESEEFFINNYQEEREAEIYKEGHRYGFFTGWSIGGISTLAIARVISEYGVNPVKAIEITGMGFLVLNVIYFLWLLKK